MPDGTIRGYSRGTGQSSRAVVQAVKEAVRAIQAEPEPVGLVSVLKLQYTLDAMVVRQHEGRPISRATMVAADITTQNYWNLANAILNAIGLRKGSRWMGTDSMRADLHYIRHNTILDPRFIKVRRAGGTEFTDLDLSEANFL